jgi:hypothetical protein
MAIERAERRIIEKAPTVVCILPQNEREAMRIFPIAVIGIMLAACTTSTGVIPAGPNTYALTVRVSPIAGGSMAAQPKALATAQAYC